MKILVAVDESDFGEPLVDFVAAHRWPEDSEFHLIHVVEPLPMACYAASVPPLALSEMEQEMRSSATRLLKKLRERLCGEIDGAKVKTTLAWGYPKEEILKIAREWPAELVVVGSHGKGCLERFVFGSVSQAVCVGAPCAVLMVRLPAAIDSHTDKASAAVAGRCNSLS